MSIALTSRSHAYNPPSVSGALPGLPAPDPQLHAGDEATSPTERGSIFEYAILPHLGAAFNLVCWLTYDQVGAEDIVQDACVRAVRYSGSIRSNNVRAWLLRIVRDAAYAKLRTKRTGIEVAFGGAGKAGDHGGIDDDVADPYAGPRAAFATTYDPAKLNAAVVALPIGLRECLILREMEELSYQEIADITGASIGTVMSRLYRARRLLTAA